MSRIPRNAVEVPGDLQAQIRALDALYGSTKAAAMVGANQATWTRIGAGLPAMKNTIVAIREGLARLHAMQAQEAPSVQLSLPMLAS